MMMESPEVVTRIAIDALLSGKASVVPGFMNTLLAASGRAADAPPACRHECRSVYADLKVNTCTDESLSAITRRPITSTPAVRGSGKSPRSQSPGSAGIPAGKHGSG